MKYFVLLVLVSFHSLACEVFLPTQMLVISDVSTGLHDVKNADCTSDELKYISETISSLDGRVASYQLEEMLKSKGHTVFVSPRSFQVQQLKSIMREQLKMPDGIQVNAIKHDQDSSILNLANGDKIEVNCNNCLYGSTQPLKIIVHGFDGTSKTHYVKADFKKMVRAFRVVLSLPSFSSINVSQMLVEELVEAIPHTDLMTDVGALKFYKTNKPIKAGQLLRLADLNAINLVKAGLKTDVIMENRMVRIRTQGISRENGAIGEIVEVFHPQKNKKYQGKVIDINKVLIEL